MVKIVLMSVGDIILDLDGYANALEHVGPVLRQADFAMASCDQCFSDLGDNPNGYWPIHYGAPPHKADMLTAIVAAGLNVLNFGNNHSLDWGYEAMEDCVARCSAEDVYSFGYGSSLSQAREPLILEKNGLRIGNLAYCSVGPEGYAATDTRPGHVPLRAYTHYEQWNPQPGTPPLIHTFADRNDLSAMVADISALRDKVDVITVSHHWGVHFIPELIADYQFEVAHAAIDAGADVIFGNHPHMPKGIELYKGKPVFYGMNDFACAGAWQSPAHQPGNRFPQSKDWDWTRHGKLLSERFGQVGHQDKSSTMIAKLLIEKGGVARVSVIPCFINDDLRPEPVTRADPRAQRICDEFQRISSSQGIDITLEWDGDEIILKGTDKLLP